jgi:hypothetical protein
MYTDVTGPGRRLCERFRALGDMTGKTADEIIAGVGSPTSRSAIAHGQVLLQWQATGYHVALLFNAEGRMVGITHESAQFYDAPPSGCLGLLTFLVVVLTIIYTVVAAVQP